MLALVVSRSIAWSMSRSTSTLLEFPMRLLRHARFRIQPIVNLTANRLLIAFRHRLGHYPAEKLGAVAGCSAPIAPTPKPSGVPPASDDLISTLTFEYLEIWKIFDNSGTSSRSATRVPTGLQLAGGVL